MSNENRAEIASVMGSTGTGKTSWLLQRIRRPKRRRMLVWSPKEPKDNYAGHLGGRVVTSTAELLAGIKGAGKGGFVFVFQPPVGRKVATGLFDVFCRIARTAENMTVIVDELHTVTQPSSAPDGWSELSMMGRAYGVELFGLSQRPASCDKDFFGNCTLHHCHRLGYEEDAKVMAKYLRVPPGELLELPDFHYFEREPRAQKPAVRGVTKRL